MDRTEQALQDVTKDLQGLLSLDGTVTGTDLTSTEQIRSKVNPKEAQEKITPEMPRFKKIYGELQNTKRTLEAKDAQIKEMQEFMKTLNTKVENVETGIAESARAEKAQELIAKETNLKLELHKAVEAENLPEIIRLQNELFESKIAVKEQKEKKETTPKVETKTTVDSEKDAKFKVWLQKNDWYEKNTDARVLADTTAKKLEDEGKSFDEILEGVNAKMKKYADVYGLELGEEEDDGEDDSEDMNLEDLIEGEMEKVSKKVASVEEPSRPPKKPNSKVDPKLLAQAERMAKLFDIPVKDMIKTLGGN